MQICVSRCSALHPLGPARNPTGISAAPKQGINVAQNSQHGFGDTCHVTFRWCPVPRELWSAELVSSLTKSLAYAASVALKHISCPEAHLMPWP